jgi:hypothetical protein
MEIQLLSTSYSMTFAEAHRLGTRFESQIQFNLAQSKPRFHFLTGKGPKSPSWSSI